MDDTLTLKVETDGLADAERRVAALHAQWTEIATMAREHKDMAVLTTQVARLDLAPGDTLVVNVPYAVTNAQASLMRDHIRAELGWPARILFVTDGSSVAVLSGQAAADDGSSGD